MYVRLAPLSMYSLRSIKSVRRPALWLLKRVLFVWGGGGGGRCCSIENCASAVVVQMATCIVLGRVALWRFTRF